MTAVYEISMLTWGHNLYTSLDYKDSAQGNKIRLSITKCQART